MKSFLYKILSFLLRGFVRLVGRTIYRLRIRGVENIPAHGGALIVANHTSYMDFVLIISSLPRYVRFVMNADVYHKRGLNWLMRGMNFIPIAPRNGNNNFDDFNAAVSSQVNDGYIVVIFAEGTVTRTGQLLEFKKGVEHLSAMINAPVIPIHFHNVQGTPFTFRGGKKRIEKFSIANLRREVLVSVGIPMHGKTTAFSLRQRIKEMEVENFNLQLGKMKPLDHLLSEQLDRTDEGAWITPGKKIAFEDLRIKLSALTDVLRPLVENEERVAVLLPKNTDAFLINLWLLLNKKISININPDFNNEERFFAMNRAKAQTLITSNDLAFTKYAPVAENVIYIEEVNEALLTGKNLNVVSRQLNRMSKSVQSLFANNSNLDDVATILFERDVKNDMRCIALSHRNLLAALQGLRQVYFFDRGSRMMSNLPLFHSYGYVIEFILPLLFDLQMEIAGDDITAEQFIAQLMESKPSVVIATPTQLESIASLSQMKNIPFLTHVFTADLQPNHHSIQVLAERGIKVMVCAGMNETSSVFAANLLNYQGKDIAGKLLEQENMEENTIGKPLPGVALKVCDYEMNELASGETGNIWVKGACVSPTKSNDFECKPQLLHGWFNTRMKGSINHKGFVAISGK